MLHLMNSLWFFVTVYIRAPANDVIGLNVTFYERNVDMLTAAQPIMIFTALYLVRRSITLFTRAHYLFLTQAT